MLNSLRSDNPAHDAARLAIHKRKVESKRQRLNIRKYNRLNDYRPYSKQIEFHEAGATFGQRCLGAGNQLGKTLAGSMEIAYHMTGLYPDEWKGARFKNPTRGWIGGVDFKAIMESTQLLMVGDVNQPDGMGTRAIPLHLLHDVTRSQTKGGVASFRVKHLSGGYSSATFKSYDTGREAFQAATLDWVWLDEEPPEDIYIEALTRTSNGQRKQFIFLTYTPIKGMTKISHSFYEDESPHKHLTVMTIEDVEHYSREEKDRMIELYPVYQRKARIEGLPILGEGMVFPIAEEEITVSPFEIPDYWAYIGGGDFGWDHPQGWVKLAWDRDADIIYIVNTYKKAETTPEVAALALRKWGIGPRDWQLPMAWPHDGYQHDKGSGLQLAAQYRDAGINMMEEHATHIEGGFGTEAGVMAILDRMQTGQFKVFATCSDWFDEFRLYHRKEGKIVKERDDLMSATRMAVMMLREAEVPPTEYDDYRYDSGAPRTSSAVGY